MFKYPATFIPCSPPAPSLGSEQTAGNMGEKSYSTWVEGTPALASLL